VREFDVLLEQWESGLSLHDDYVGHCVTIGAQVDIELVDGSRLHGAADGVDSDGALIVLTDGVQRRVTAGDVTHVR
jgi:BirA family transcriptional regulator, biotin operon repressor / biotin---[acetyl-CoA-carboxylase] ligase